MHFNKPLNLKGGVFWYFHSHSPLEAQQIQDFGWLTSTRGYTTHPTSTLCLPLQPSFLALHPLSPSLCAMKMASSSLFVFFVVLLCLASRPSHSHTESSLLEDTNATAESNASRSRSQDSFADMIDRALEKEFTENEQTGGEQIWTHFSSFGFTVSAFRF